jgi:hypothetical protein
MAIIFRVGEIISIRANDQYLPRGAQVIGTAVCIGGAVEVTTYAAAAVYVDGNPRFDRILQRVVNTATWGLPISWAMPSTFEEEQYGTDPEPLPGDGPDYHAEHAAWALRQGVTP